MLVYSPEEEEEFFDQIDQVYTLTEEGHTEEAEKLLMELDSSILDPKENCSVGAIMLDSIYAFYDQTGDIEKALPYFLNETAFLTEKMKGDSVTNPVHFITTGSIYYALEDLDKAREYFKLAYQAGKKGLFSDFHADFLFMALASDADFAEFKENFVPNLDEEEDELTDEQQELMDEYCEKGNAEMEEEHFNVAADYFKKAYAVLPEPKDEWEATGYITASLGDAYFNAKKYKEAKEQLLIAAKFYEDGETPNPFVLLRLGAACMEIGEEQQALEHLLQAYEMEGNQLFEEDKKYLDFLKKHRKLA
jgi:tetratricopeptide (TPR) repeat protein